MNISVNRVRHLQGTRFFSLIKNCYLLPSVRYSSTNQPKIADRRSQIADRRSQIADRRSQIADRRSQIADRRQ